MALFPKDEAVERAVLIREKGTKQILILVATVAVLWFGGGKIWDYFLLRKDWGQLKPQAQELTVVGTLDSRGSYEANLFRVIQAEGTYRAELTNHGWESIFNNKHPLCTTEMGRTIKAVIQQDSETGYAMLAPFIRVGVNQWMNRKDIYEGLSESYPITTHIAMTPEEEKSHHSVERKETLGSLTKFVHTKGFAFDKGEDKDSEGGGGGERAVEHGLAIPAQVMTEVAPIVMITSSFRGAWLEEQPPTVLGGTTYKVHLQLTPEGKSRFFQWSHSHTNESMLFILGGEVMAAGRIVQTMDVSEYEITNLKDGVAARKMVDYVNSHVGK